MNKEQVQLNPIHRYSRWLARYAPLILVVLCGLRIAAGVQFLKPFIGDNAAEHYLPIADRMCTQSRFNGPDSRPDSKVPPGYPLLLAASKAIGGQHQLPLVICFQALSDLVCALGIYYFGRRYLQPAASALAGVLWLLFPPALATSRYITAETLFTCVFTLAILWFMHSLWQGKPAGMTGSGVLLGVATLIRGTPLFLPPLLGWVIWRLNPQRRWLALGGFLAGMAVVVLPWTVRNWLVLDDFIPVQVGFGSVVLQGSDAKYFTADGKEREYPALYRTAIQSGISKPSSGKESQIDNWLMRIGRFRYRQRWDQQPGSFLPFALHKFVRLWYGTESGSRVNHIGLGLCSGVVLPLAFVQLWRRRATHPILLLTVVTILGYFVALHLVGLPEFRYVFPVFPFLLLLASQTILEPWSQLPDGPQPHPQS